MSKRLLPTDSTAYVTLCTAAASLPFPPTAGAFAVVPAGWSTEGAGVVPQFDLEIYAAGALSLTGAELFGGVLRALVIGDTTITSVDHTVDQFTLAAHGWKTGDGPVFIDWATSPPAEISETTGYYIIRTGANTFKIATTRALALAGTALAFSGNGVGAMTLSDSSATQRVHWQSRGLLDATITLDVDRDYGIRCDHSPDVIAYALTGALSASTVSAILMPVQER